MPEWGMLPIPKKLLKQGVRDMLRISDARMSGTSYGACILHVSPEAHIGGPLAAVRTGDLITVDVPNRSIHLHVSDEQIADRLRSLVAATARLSPRLQQALRPAHPPGGRRLRLRLPGRIRRRAGAGNPLALPNC